jgi:hypothetical protein
MLLGFLAIQNTRAFETFKDKSRSRLRGQIIKFYVRFLTISKGRTLH